MWSMMSSMGHPAHTTMGPMMVQKRHFSMNPMERVAIIPGKTFTNPNFVISHHPSVHGHSTLSTPFEEIIPCDRDSSQSLIETLKEHNLDVVKTKPPKRSRRNRRHRRKKSKRSDKKKEMKDIIETEPEADSLEVPGVTVSSENRHTFHLADFIIHDCPTPVVEEPGFVAAFISVSPSNITLRERQVSVSSEDSFIVFDYGDDEEEESSKGETASEVEEDEGEDEVDFVTVAVPKKKVRFAEDSTLCKVHPMVQWSFAYQQARKGPWEEYARDRDRFKRKVADMKKILTPVLDAAHREAVYQERFQGVDQVFNV